MKQRAVLPVLLLCCAGVFVDAFLPCPIIRRQQKISPYTITEATVESSSDTTASSPSNDEATGGYVPSGLTSQEYQAIRAKEQRQQQQQQGTNLGAWGPRFDRGEAPLGDWMVDSNLWINGFVDGGVDDGKNQQVVAPPRVRSVALVAPPGKKGSLVSVQEAQDWLDYHAEWFGLVEEDEDEDDNEEDGNKDDDNQERNVKVAVVDLTGRTWDAEALAVLQPGLVNIASEVEILHLGNTSCTTSESNAASVMKVWSEVFASSPCSLKEIDLSDNDLFQPQVAEYVGKLLSNSPLLERLYMVNCNLEKDVDGSNNHVSPIWTGILSASKNCRLHELILDANPLAGARMAQDVAQVLERCPHLHVFSYCGNQPNANGTRGLADALHTMVQQQTCAQNHPLAILRLENCAFNNEGSVDSLANALANAPNLQRLSLRDSTDKDTTIGLTATHKLLQGLVQANCPLECLDLGTWYTLVLTWMKVDDTTKRSQIGLTEFFRA